jgi:predicted DNA-binding protein
MCAEMMQGEGKQVHVTVRLSPQLYSRLVLLAHRQDRSLGDEIRLALEQHIRAYPDSHEPL